MNIFASFVGSGAKKESSPIVAAEIPAAEINHSVNAPAAEHRRVRRRTGRTGRTEVYAVRVRDSFKGEILALQGQLQLERQKSSRAARKVTEGEIIELMLEAYKATRRTGEAGGNAVLLTKDVWDGVHEIARHSASPAAQVVEELVVHRIAELGLLPRKHASAE
jgi:hypothetical protein